MLNHAILAAILQKCNAIEYFTTQIVHCALPFTHSWCNTQPIFVEKTKGNFQYTEFKY